MLQAAGAAVDSEREVVRISEAIVRPRAGDRAPRVLALHARRAPAVHYGGDAVHFDPGSSGVNVLDPATLEHRPAITPDLIRLIQVAERLPAYDAQSTAVVCGDVPQAIGISTGSTWCSCSPTSRSSPGPSAWRRRRPMFDMLAIFRDGREGWRTCRWRCSTSARLRR